MTIENANDHPFKVAIVKDAEMFANSHPFKVFVEGGSGGGEARVVTELREEGESGYIDLILKEETSAGDIYDEWIWALQENGETYGWEHLGATNEVTIEIDDQMSDTSENAVQNKVIKSYVDGRVLTNTGAPTTATVGTVGQLLEDTTNGDLYICTAISGSTYTWEEVGAGGGSGPTVVQTTGTSTADVMSQNATTSMVFADPSTKKGVRIGAGSSASSTSGTAVGNKAAAYGMHSTAVGSGATANEWGSLALGVGASVPYGAQGSVALGDHSAPTQTGEVNVGTSISSRGFNSSNYRLLTGLYDPQSAHDAATKGYVDTAVAGASYDPTISNNTLYL